MGTQPNGLKVHNLPTTRLTDPGSRAPRVDARRSRPAPKAKGLAGHPTSSPEEPTARSFVSDGVTSLARSATHVLIQAQSTAIGGWRK